MDTVTDDSDRDLELLFKRIDELERLVKEQKEFFVASGETWRRPLDEEQSRAQHTSDERVRFKHQAKQPSEIGPKREALIGELEGQLTETRKSEMPEQKALHHEKEALVRKLRLLEEETTEHLESFEDVKAELENQLNSRAQLENSTDRVAELEHRLSHVESELRQRQEEIEQTRSLLTERIEFVARLEAELEDTRARENALQQKLEGANGWVFRLAGERAENEKQLARLAHERDVKSRELQSARGQIARLSARIDDMGIQLGEARALSAKPFARIPASTLPVARRPAEPAIKVPPSAGKVAPHDRVGLESLLEPVAQRDKQQFLERLQVIGTGQEDQRGQSPQGQSSIRESSADRMVATPRIQSMGTVLLPRNIELERKLKAAQEQAEWLRRLSVILHTFPKRWTWKLAPAQWLRKRLLEMLQREGIFDGPAYLDRNPDVADARADPLTHYLKHGMSEGRER